MNMKTTIKLILLTLALNWTFISCDKDDDSSDNQSTSTVTDADGNVYSTIKIGTQTWMVENLKTTKYNDGTSIPNVTNQTAWNGLTTGAYCYYNNDAAVYGTKYGCLYNWYTVNTEKLAPKGWHVPTDDEWTTLSDFLGGEDVAGSKMTSTTGWDSPNASSTNSSGFTALPGGYRLDSEGFFDSAGETGCWWSSTECNLSKAWGWGLYEESNSFYQLDRDAASKIDGYSIRCIRDN